MKHFHNYQEYLAHWLFKAVRKARMQQSGWKCIHCGAAATEVHHNAYPQPWGTFDVPANIDPICHDCHCKIHGKAA